MKIEKKRGLKGMRIAEHNKKLLYVILILIVILIGVVVAIKVLEKKEKLNNNIGNKTDSCSIDEDCIKVQTSCCSCNMGGDEKCVLKKDSQGYIENLTKCGKVSCIALYNCKELNCACISGECGYKKV